MNDNWGKYKSEMPISVMPEDATESIQSMSTDRTNVFGLCVHHTDSANIEAARKALSAKKCSTHIMIDRDGLQYVEMSLEKRASACVGFNKWMWQLDVVGRFEKETPSREQLLALKSIIKTLACGRKVQTIDKKFADRCRHSSKEEVQKETETKFEQSYLKLKERAEKRKSWDRILDKVPFLVIYHGEVRPTRCCGKNLIPELQKILAEIKEEQ